MEQKSYDGGRDGLKERGLDQGDRSWGDERKFRDFCLGQGRERVWTFSWVSQKVRG